MPTALELNSQVVRGAVQRRVKPPLGSGLWLEKSNQRFFGSRSAFRTEVVGKRG